MKKILQSASLLLFFHFLHGKTFAQAPQAIPYQAEARNSAGDLYVNQLIYLRFTIHNGASGGAIVYQESTSTTTNALGLFTINIGAGFANVGSFSAIDWSGGSKFLQVELALPANSYTDMGTTQMLSVPYALYAAKSGNTYSAGTGINISGNTITNTSPDQTVTISGAGSTSVTGTYPNFTVTGNSGSSAFNAKKSGTQVNQGSFQFTQVTFTDESFDVNNDFSGSQFTCPASGLYHFDVTVHWQTTNAAGVVITYLAVNGSLPYSALNYVTAVNTQYPQNISTDLMLNAGDVVRVITQSQLAETINGSNGSQLSFFSGHRIK